MNQILYVSWGGSGRSASLRAAYRRAVAEEAGLVYLAILDDETFGDVDEDLALVVVDELEWLLDAQINLTRLGVGTEVPVRVLVRQGEVVSRVAEVAETLGGPLILIGAPLPLPEEAAVVDLLDRVAAATGQRPELVNVA